MERLLTPSMISAWLECAHVLPLKRQVELGIIPKPERGLGEFARLVMDKGLRHEADCLDDYRTRGLTVFEVLPRQPGEDFSSWVARVGNPMADGHEVIFQMPFLHDGMRGIADFLLRVVDDVTGDSWYEPVDAKLTRTEAKVGHVLQLCFYSEAMSALTGTPPRSVHVWLGSGERESIAVTDVLPYWRRLRRRLMAALADGLEVPITAPEPNNHCQFCDVAGRCEDQWRAADSLMYVAGIRTAERHAFEIGGVGTLTALSVAEESVAGVLTERQSQLRSQANLQVVAAPTPEVSPPFVLLDPVHDAAAPIGFGRLPAPDDGDIFLDFEGDPFWTAATQLFFLFGYIERVDGEWRYCALWAHDRDDEARQVSALLEHFAARRDEYPNMHVFHYNHTERSALERLCEQHGVGEAELEGMIASGLFVDLLPIVRESMQVGVESYGLKHIERLTEFERHHDIDKGAGAVVEYEAFMVDRDPERLGKIGVYNEDDVRATLALRDWLVMVRPPDVEWRDAVLESPESEIVDLDERVRRLHEHPEGSPEHFLGHVIGYWNREWKTHLANLLSKMGPDASDPVGDPTVITALTPDGLVERLGKTGKPITPAMRFTFPPQQVGTEFTDPKSGSATALFAAGEGVVRTVSVPDIDAALGTVDIVWNEKLQEEGLFPTELVINDWVAAKPKPETLGLLADCILDRPDESELVPLAMALLRRDRPVFAAGVGPVDGVFTDDLKSICEWVHGLGPSVIAIQGPPGTGKSHTGAHIVHRLITSGVRVGITAMSHHAIDNLLTKVLEVFVEEGDMAKLSAFRRASKPDRPLLGVTYGDNKAAAKPQFNLVAGTTWLFASEQMRDALVDVLIVDEAGQLALADALAASTSARRMVLLGDPQQLAQVSQATHPAGSGVSVLEHLIGEHGTIQPDMGVFLSQSWRMHHDVCDFISTNIYDGRLTSHVNCARQGTSLGTGLRWIRAEHDCCIKSSTDEADRIIAAIGEVLSGTWTNFKGITGPITAADVMVVAAYNEQVDLIRSMLDRSAATAGVKVGTVDKFQGQEAAVVFFSMATSSSEFMPRTADFLFSRNRLNVAISRARCLAYLVCTEELLDTQARTIEEMGLLSTLCAFVEAATPT